MPAPDRMAQTLSRLLGGRRTERGIPLDLRTTVRPRGAPSGGAGAPEPLAWLRQLEQGGLQDKITILGALGEGGMGQVHLALQRVMGREVALKTLATHHRDDQAALMLLQEGWITGTLEHPNVVPVYDIGLDAGGAPLVLLKRIEGTDWGQLLEDEPQVRRRFGVGDPLEWHLRVLVQVCNAISYAHSRGIVHRDLKPQNVMIGEFGEVYVVDWGIAVSLTDTGDGRLPLASEAREPAGTPCYMAPEVLAEQGADERTDVYLLGATLYELLARRPPHIGDTLEQVLQSIQGAPRPLPPEVPAELAQICARAMAPAPADRHASVAALRRDLESYLQHRGSIRLARQAEERLAALQQELAAPPGDGQQQRLALYGLYSECRFGFHEALRTWPENEAAASGLAQATTRMVRYEVAQGDPRSAATLLAELPAPPEELRRLVADLERRQLEQRTQMERLARVGRQLDPNTGRGARLVLALFIGLAWSVLPLLGSRWIKGTPREAFSSFILTNSVFLCVLLLLAFLARRTLLTSLLNRRLVYCVASMLLGEIVLKLLCWQADLTPARGVLFSLFFWTCVLTLLAISLEWRLLPTVLVHVVCLAWMAADLELRFVLTAVSNFALAMNALVIWNKPRQPGPRPWVDFLAPRHQDEP